jgi:predicted PurR-regulated permease PerM
MNKKNHWFVTIPVTLLVLFLAWYFSNILVYIFIAAILSLFGKPLVRLLDRVKIGKFHLPRTFNAFITLAVMYGFIFGIFILIIPMLFSQASFINDLDVKTIGASLSEPLNNIQSLLMKYNLMDSNDNLVDIASKKIVSLLSLTSVTNIVETSVDIFGNIFIAVFAIGFITFFFLRQERMLLEIIMLLTPEHYQTEIKHIYFKIIYLLSRYFRGLLIDLTIVMTLISIGMFFLGLKNALMIGIFAGMMNIIPYVGPIIGAIIAVLLAVSGNLNSDFSTVLLPMIMKICGILAVVNMLDAFIFQPTIYSKSVKAHPLEIFLVIMIAGSLAGILGMILAIPSYTVIRIIAKEFLYKSRFVQKITEKI